MSLKQQDENLKISNGNISESHAHQNIDDDENLLDDNYENTLEVGVVSFQ